MLRLRVLSLAAALVCVAFTTQVPGAAGQISADWPMGGHDLANSRWNPAERTLGSSNVDDLAVRWTRQVAGDVSATPAVVGGAVYFPDWGGQFWKLDARSGAVIWSRRVADYVGIANAVSRSSPAVVGSTVYIGTQEGARLLAIDTATGNLRWSAPMDPHPAAVLTQSPSVYNGVVYQGVSSIEEGFAADPNYACCTFRGSLVATDAATGRQLWKQYTIPYQGEGSDIFSGAAVWSGLPMIDPESRTVYITTGNNYEVPQATKDCQLAGGTAAECLPEWNTINSIIAFDLRTGARKWATGQVRFDDWNSACLPGIPPNNCPIMQGPDWDFADGAHLFALRLPDGRVRRAVGAGQKSGEYWMVDALTGEVIWSSAVGPGGHFGGIEWGTASDGRRIYFAENNSDEIPYQLPDGRTITYSSFGALDPLTGRLIWQVAEPHGGHALAAVTTANGVVYAGAMSGHMYAFDAATGRQLWEHQGQGSANAGPAVVDGTVYWGNGYARWGQGTPATTFYAFALPR